MEWTYQGRPVVFDDISEYVGFVYLIENLDNGRKYVGKKNLWKPKVSRRKNPKTGKIKTTRTRVESDWKDYYGSSKELESDVEKLGTDRFSREIIKFCRTKGQMSYDELKEQISRRVLESDEYYNGIIQVRIHRRHLDGSED